MKQVPLRVLRFAFPVALALTAGRAQAGFSFNASDYGDGEELSDNKGTSGGHWRFAEDSAKPTGDGAGGVYLGEDVAGFEFIANAAPGEAETTAVYEYEFSCDSLFEGLPTDSLDGLAAISPARLDESTGGFYVMGDGRWNAATAEGCAPTAKTALTCRIQLREVGGRRFVSYFAKDSNGEYVPLVTRSGRKEFLAGETDNEVRISSFSGVGTLKRINGEESEPASEPRALYWVGGKSGDWSDGAKWSLTDGGESVNEAPQSGDVAFVSGEVELTVDGKTATVRDLAVEVGESSGAVIGGAIDAGLSADLSRPRIGEALAVKSSAGIFGVTPSVTYAWTRGSATKAWESSPISTASSFTPTADDLGHWFRVTAEADDGSTLDRTFYFSKLPVLYMTTDDGKTPTAAKEEHEGKVYVQGNDDWKSLYDGKMSIKVRGNSTRNYPKKPWKLKLDKKTDMFSASASRSTGSCSRTTTTCRRCAADLPRTSRTTLALLAWTRHGSNASSTESFRASTSSSSTSASTKTASTSTTGRTTRRRTTRRKITSPGSTR